MHIDVGCRVMRGSDGDHCLLCGYLDFIPNRCTHNFPCNIYNHISNVDHVLFQRVKVLSEHFHGLMNSENALRVGFELDLCAIRSTILTSPRSIHRITILSLCQTPVVQIANGPISSFPCLRFIRLAMTTSVIIRSPTTMSSWSEIGFSREEK